MSGGEAADSPIVECEFYRVVVPDILATLNEGWPVVSVGDVVITILIKQPRQQ